MDGAEVGQDGEDAVVVSPCAISSSTIMRHLGEVRRLYAKVAVGRRLSGAAASSGAGGNLRTAIDADGDALDREASRRQRVLRAGDGHGDAV